MSIIEIILISLAVSADAFATAIYKGLTLKTNNLKEPIIIGLYFGFFQAIMPLIGYLFSNSFNEIIINIDHWIAFVILLILGIKSLIESNKNEINSNEKIDIKTMIILSFATSIDALAVGITFSFLNINIIYSCIIIGFITFTTSTIGAKIGNKVGLKYKKLSQVLGGIILIIIGFKILFEHLNIL